MSVDNIGEEGRRQLAWRRLLDAALRHGAEVIAREEAQENEERSCTASQPAGPTKGDEDNEHADGTPQTSPSL